MADTPNRAAAPATRAPDVIRPTRHKWDRRDKHNKVCTVCGTWAQQRPHPYERRWFTEWRLPDGSYTDNLWGGKTPPCEPAANAGSETAITAKKASR